MNTAFATKKLCPILLLAIAVPTSYGAALIAGYTEGPGSQLLTANGGGGDLLFNDSASLGGDQDIDGTAFPASNSVLVPGAGIWDIGDTVSITGVAFTIRGNNSDTGTITFDIRQGANGDGASGAGSLSSLGTEATSYTSTGEVDVRYVNFDNPVTFVVDVNTTTIGINFQSDQANFAYKADQDNIPGDRLQRYNFANGNTPNSFMNFSVAGTVTPVPEPTTYAFVFGLGILGFALFRRR